MAYLITIKITDRGTASLNGPSAFGHMWYSLDDGSENPPLSFGPKGSETFDFLSI